MGSGALGGCHACIKYLMFAFNFIFWLIGCALVGLGIWVLVDDNFKKLAEDSSLASLQYAGIALVVVGSIVMMVGFFGCCGAIRESQCLLVMFFICMVILFIMLVGGGAVCLIFQDQIIEKAQTDLSERVDNYDMDKKDGFVDVIQSQFRCCGYDSSLDYGVTPPDSCPPVIDENGVNIGGVAGCRNKVEDIVKEYSVIFAGVAIGAGVMMLLGMIFSMMLCCAIRDID